MSSVTIFFDKFNQVLTKLASSANMLIVTDGLNSGWAKMANSLYREIRLQGEESNVDMLGLVPYGQLLKPSRFKVRFKLEDVDCNA